MDVVTVFKPNDQIRLAGHGSMYCVSAHLVAQEAVVDVRRYAANVVARIKVLQGDGEISLGKIFRDFMSQKSADIVM